MEQSTPHTIATFTGTLVRRDYTPGQRFVQLVFREGKENHLCVSSRAAAAELPIGKKYRVEGEFRQVGDRAFIHEPKIWVAQKRRQKWFLRKPVLLGSSAAAALLVVGGVVFALHGGSQSNLQAKKASVQSAFQQETSPSDHNDNAAPQTTTDTPSTTTDTQTNTTPTTTNKTTPKTTTPTPTPTDTTPTPTPTPTPDPTPTPTPDPEPTPEPEPTNPGPTDPPVDPGTQ